MRFEAARRLLFRTVSQIGITYRHGGGTGVASGDRLPWTGAGGADNFAPLRSMAWQVHVYGIARPEFRASAQALGLPLHEFAWSDAAEAANLPKDTACVIRPDGHLAVLLPVQDGEALAGFLKACRP